MQSVQAQGHECSWSFGLLYWGKKWNGVIDDIEHDHDEEGADSEDDVDGDVSCSACCSGAVDQQRLIHDNLLVSKTRAPGIDPTDKVNAPPYSKDEFYILLQHFLVVNLKGPFYRDFWQLHNLCMASSVFIVILVFRESEPSAFCTFMTLQT